MKKTTKKPGKYWIQRFRDEPQLVMVTLLEWLELAPLDHHIFGAKESRYENWDELYEQGNLLVQWCDSVARIDPSPLLEMLNLYEGLAGYQIDSEQYQARRDRYDETDRHLRQLIKRVVLFVELEYEELHNTQIPRKTTPTQDACWKVVSKSSAPILGKDVVQILESENIAAESTVRGALAALVKMEAIVNDGAGYFIKS